MQDDKSGAGYGNHGGDGTMGGADGAQSGDHKQGKPVEGEPKTVVKPQPDVDPAPKD